MASYAKKMTLVPVDETAEPTTEEFPTEVVVPVPQSAATTTTKRNSIRKYALERQKKMIRVILKLAQSGSYDMDGSLLRIDGSPLEDADMVSLLLYTMSPGRIVRGLHEFVEILLNAGVTPGDVINTQVKEMLMKRGNEGVNRQQQKRNQVRQPVDSLDEGASVDNQDHEYSLPPPPKLHGPFPLTRPSKRRLIESNPSEPAAKIARTEKPWDEDSEGEFDE